MVKKDLRIQNNLVLKNKKKKFELNPNEYKIDLLNSTNLLGGKYIEAIKVENIITTKRAGISLLILL